MHGIFVGLESITMTKFVSLIIVFLNSGGGPGGWFSWAGEWVYECVYCINEKG